MELIKVTKNEQGSNVVSARELYGFLQATERFSNWFERQLQYGFIEGIDYVGCEEFNTLANQTLINFALTLDCAKEIAMVQRTEKGKEARQYFIQCEKQLKEQTKPLTITEIIIQQAIMLDAQAKRLESIENNQTALQDRLNNVQAKITDIDRNYYTIAGYCSLRGFKKNIHECNALGKKASKLSKDHDYEIKKTYSEIFGQVNSYHLDILALCF